MTLRLRSSTSSRSKYSSRSVCNRRSSQEALGPPRGMLEISRACERCAAAAL
ncbi:Uncharacterised protein [Mycobacteroides abscessus subsp. abscessus]|nr:Uncharacterised protein [Mycobacteroides abscessus subsp. abscessus]